MTLPHLSVYPDPGRAEEVPPGPPGPGQAEAGQREAEGGDFAALREATRHGRGP